MKGLGIQYTLQSVIFFFPTKPYGMKHHPLALQLVAETPVHGPLGYVPEPNPNLYPDPESVA